MTSGMLAGTGPPSSSNVPSTWVVVTTIGPPLRSAPHCSQVTPGAKGATGPLGTYTMTFGTGSGVPYWGWVPATILPVMLVTPTSHRVGGGQVVHEATHALFTPGPPQVWPTGQDPQSSGLPQPSSWGPHLKP